MIGVFFGLMLLAPPTQEEVGSEPPLRVFVGRVTDAEGRPVPDALIEWGHFLAADADRESTRADDKGEFRLETRRVGRDYRLGVSAEGFAPAWHDGVIPRRAEDDAALVDFKLAAGSGLAGVVADENGRPVAGITITAQTAPHGIESSFSSGVPATPLPGAARTATTDALGRFRLSDLPAGNEISLRATAGGTELHEKNHPMGEEARIQIVRSRLPGQETPREVGVLRGRVIDHQTGKPVSAFKVMLRYRPEPIEVESETGEFAIMENVRRGAALEVRIFAPPYVPCVARLTATALNDRERPTIELEPGRPLWGRFVDGETGLPIEGVRVLAGTYGEKRYKYVEWSSFDSYADGHHSLVDVQRDVSDAEGRFAIAEGAAPNVLVVVADGYERRVVMPGDRPASRGDGTTEFRLEPEARFVGSVALSPAARKDVTVQVYQDGIGGIEHMHPHVKLDEEGRFESGGLGPGAYRLVLYDHEAGFGFPRWSCRMQIGAGETKEVVLGKMPGEFSLAGSTAPFTRIGMSPGFETEYGSFGVTADADGRYRFEGLLPGKYRVDIGANSASSGSHVNTHSEIEVKGDMAHDIRAFGQK
jgi:protocatechuate 3,4-dioxygenase beta subunit